MTTSVVQVNLTCGQKTHKIKFYTKNIINIAFCYRFEFNTILLSFLFAVCLHSHKSAKR